MDEIPDVVSVRRFREFGADEKDEVFETLLNLAEAIKDIPKKSLRKTLELTLAVVRYKGEQVSELKEKLLERTQTSLDATQNDRLLGENERLKQMLEKLEDEKEELSQKNKELTDELLQQQKRLQAALNTADHTDKDSSDPLSELDKQEELLRNISRKNKHIKRLLHEIESLQNQNIEQSKTIILLEKQLQLERSSINEVKLQLQTCEKERQTLKNTINELNVEIARLEGNITYLEEERESSERDLKDFIDKLEIKAQSWKNLLDEKETELSKLRGKLTNFNAGSSSKIEADNYETHNGNGVVQEATKLMHTLELRDQQIEKLEKKVKSMAEEMLGTTQLMNKLSNERENERNPKNPRGCCKLLEQSLQAANKRCREMSEMLERSEEDNALKSKQAHQAISALEAYQRGEDGLPKALRKCTTLEQKIISRDKQIRALIMQLNSLHEIANENTILRKRLNIPDDVVIATRNLAAKERSKEKMIDRLTLKLRASEEMRLQLMLEKNDLNKQITELQKRFLQKQKVIEGNDETLTLTETNGMSTEIGEVAESIQETNAMPAEGEQNHMCAHCNCQQKTFLMEHDITPKPMVAELQAKYHEVLEENDTLRHGMHEILEKLREYDACSEHITIDTEMLCRLLQALQSTSTPNSPKQLQKELRSLQAREEALRLLLNTTQTESTTQGKESNSTETDELPSIGSMRQEYSLSFSKMEKTSLPTTPLLQMSPLPPAQRRTSIVSKSVEQISKNDKRSFQQEIAELQIYRKRYEKLCQQIQMDSTRLSAEQAMQLTNLEIDLSKLQSSYSFMREDFDQTLAEAQQKQMEHIQIVAALRLELNTKDLELKRLETDLEQLKSQCSYSAEEYESLLKTKNELQTQLAQLVERTLSGRIEAELKINDICANYGIIEDNFELNYLTVDEYKMQKDQLNNAEQQQTELQRKTMQLESLLEIAQDQILSQQRLLNEITDNHIDLRHLVADLQSQSEEKHLLAKMQRELSGAKSKLMQIEAENDEIKRKFSCIEKKLTTEQQRNNQIENDNRNEQNRKNLKIKFLLKSLYALKGKYSKFTPLIFLTNFVYAYTRFVQKEQTTSKQQANEIETIFENLQDNINAKLQAQQLANDNSSNLFKLIKSETQCKLLKEHNVKLQSQIEALQQEMSEQLIRFATETEHWHTIEILWSHEEDAKPTRDTNIQKKELQTVAVNTDATLPPSLMEIKRHTEVTDKCLSPIESPVKLKCAHTGTQTVMETPLNIAAGSKSVKEIAEPKREPTPSVVEVQIQTISQTMETQAVQTCEQTNQEDNGKVYQESETETVLKLREELLIAQKCIDELQETLKVTKSTTQSQASNKEQGNDIIEKTIMSFNALLMEKDKSISKYQDLLQNERDQNNTQISKMRADVDGLKSTVTNLNFNIKTKDMEILELKTKLEVLCKRRNSNEKLDLASANANVDENVDNSLNELSDEKIEEMFEHDAMPPITITTATTTTSINQQKQQQIVAINAQMKGLEEKLEYAENNLKIKEEEISLMKEKLKLCQEREKSLETTQNPEIEKLRSLIEEKDKHINDLMDTLKNFHEDQQNFLKDSSSYSENQITKLSADLIRTEATNKIYQTQVEALRRQVTSLTQREKQARELNQSLRNQLIKRPVVSIKTELNTRVKTESMQKRIQQLELELEEARAQIQRQQIIIETKRAKSACEVNLWEKQKRWQQNAEKFKAKLEETECTLEKTRTLLQSARNTISRLEKDKQSLEIKLGRATHGVIATQTPCGKCCRTMSCPNTNRNRSSSISGAGGVGGKYTPSESPETFTGGSSEYSSPSHSMCDGGGGVGSGVTAAGGGGIGGTSSSNGRSTTAAAAQQRSELAQHGSLVEALKARIEMQQRRILAMELEGKGKNAMSCGMEKLKEKLSAIEAQNIRLEARNLQLQLDNDLLRQNDVNDRLQKRIKHLEDYIIALKEELAQVEARRSIVCKCAGVKMSSQQQTQSSADQTILSLRNLVEKLRAENKYLKDGRRSSESRSSTEDVSRLQQIHADSLEKIAALQAELNAKSKSGKSSTDLSSSSNEELKFIKEQLIKKTQLLQKAKVLLTRAAAKEKILKEQLSLWKRKCSELQNVPVIEEISE